MTRELSAAVAGTTVADHPSSAPVPPTQVSLTRLLHLASTMLPVGAFSYSQGLEWAVESGLVTDRAQAERWIFDCLRWSIGRYEAPLLISAQRAWLSDDDELIAELNARMIATRETSELRAETLQMGYSLRQWCNDARTIEPSWLERLARIESPAYPVVFAAVAAAWSLETRTLLTVYLWTWLENQVSAAMKAVPLGQTDGQRILLAAGELIDGVAQQAIVRADESPPGAWATQCPGLAIASSCHEAQYSRLFRS